MRSIPMHECLQVHEKRRLLEIINILVTAPGKATAETLIHFKEDMNKLFSEIFQEDVQIALIKNKRKNNHER